MPTLNQMGVVGSGFGILQPKQKMRFSGTFVGLGSAVAGTNGRDITRQITVMQRPTVEFAEVAIHRYNSTAYVAGKYEYQPITITVEDDITGLATTAIQGQMTTQQQLIGADVGPYLPAAATGSDYKFGTIIQMLDGNEGVVESWELAGCWIKQVNYGDLDYNSSDANTIELTIRFDTVTQVISPSASSYGSALGGSAG